MNNHMNESMNNFLMKLNTHMYTYMNVHVYIYIHIYICYIYIYIYECMYVPILGASIPLQVCVLAMPL